MSNNPFADAIKKQPERPLTRTVVPKPFFTEQARAENLRERARNMTRQDMFNNGMLTVGDMDDEELRCGRMRGPDGKIPRASKSAKDIPRDLYDAMVQEHLQRTQERYRENMDLALDTIIEIMTDPANEPKDRLEAAKHIKEQVMGKPVDRVAIKVDKAPWEDIMAEVGRTTRAQHQRLQEGIVDAEVVETPDESTSPANDSIGHEPAAQADSQASDGHDNGPIGDPRIVPAEDTATHDNPVNSTSTAPPPEVSNSQQLRWAACDTQDLAARRAAQRNRMAMAKKQRIIKRTLGAMPNPTSNLATEQVSDPDDPTVGKLRHTLS